MADIAKLIYKKNTMYSSGWGFSPETQGSTGQVLTKTTTWYDWDDGSNTKVFTLPSDVTTAEALAVAQDAYDWYIAWNISVLKKWSAYAYVVRTESSGSELAFYQWRIGLGDDTYAWVTDLFSPKISLSISDWTVTEISTLAPSLKSVLATWVDYSTPYTPEYDWSPATKKYVDDYVWNIETLLSNI